MSTEMADKLKYIHQKYVDSSMFFIINGECHGQKVFNQDMQYQLQGKKVIKSIQERVIDMRS